MSTHQEMGTAFSLHPQLDADTSVVAELPLCRCLLMHDARYPWLILVPRIDGLKELHEVPPEAREKLFDEIERASRALQKVAHAHKLNVAALGNQVPQLHIHVIARQLDDPAWPGPVWGVGAAEPYTAQDKKELITTLNSELAG
jgi:diadenosine tetraphosphate (Ap4A) HIT family hydrolase